MAFGLGKLAVLESKLDIYEDLSKEMLDKLERAVTTISDNSNKIAIVLERHENRLDEGERMNDAIIQMIKDHQKYDDRMFKQLDEKIEGLNKKTDRNTKFVIGATAVIATVVTLLQVAPPLIRVLTSGPSTATMVPVEFVIRELS
jgi:histidinol-phosphate/aromatic aminotransferase/cobyric acid decarboxylase-like protein